MAQTTVRILKSSQVNIEGKCLLGLPQKEHNSTLTMNTTVKQPQAGIIENNDEHVIIQVVCSCGKQINIRGEYIAPHSS